MATTSVYVDTNIYSRYVDGQTAAEQLDALWILDKWKDKLDLLTSPETKRELENIPREQKRQRALSRSEKDGQLPLKSGLKILTYGAAMYGAATYGGAGGDELLAGLKQIFDAADSKHIEQAVRHRCNYFLTLDKNSIINRVAANQRSVERLCGDMSFVTPVDLIRILGLDQDSGETLPHK